MNSCHYSWLPTVIAYLAMSAHGQADDYKLPNNPKTPVIVYDSKGGQIQRKSNEPMMQILADGTVKLGSPWGMRKALQGKLNKKELQQLLSFIVEKQKFRTIQSADLKLPRNLIVADASTTIIKIKIDGKPHDVSAYALGLGGQAKPNSPIARAVAIRNRLQRAQAVIHCGGKQGVAKYLKKANKALLIEQPDAVKLSAKDLRYAWSYKNGAFNASFLRIEKLQATNRHTSVSMYFRPGAAPNIRVSIRETPRR